MATIEIDGSEIHYQLLGAGTPVALTPGGRLGGEAVRDTADLLAEEHLVVLWDRRNTGASHIWFGPEPEQLVWADDLAVLLEHLDLAPAYLAGASAGARVSYLTAIRHPAVVAGLALWSVSGGPYSSQNLGYQYHTPFINEVIRAGTVGLADTPFFRERILANEANRRRLLSYPPEQVVAALRRWDEAFYYRSDTPVVAATVDQLQTITCPTLIFEGNDDFHPPETARALHELVRGSELCPLPWTRDEWMHRFVGRSPGTVMDLYVRLAPTVSEFVQRSETLRLAALRSER